MKKQIKKILNKLPYIKGLYNTVEVFNENACYAPGHYYSPIVSVKEIKNREAEIWKGIEIDGIREIDLNVAAQKLLVTTEFTKYYSELPFKKKLSEGCRYSFENDMYSYTDGIFLYGMMRYLKPNKIIEVGSGHSSALMMDVNTIFFNNSIDLTFIEPNPERLYSTISEEDKAHIKISVNQVQQVQLSLFQQLQKGDILFIDSTHVSKCGSDVNFIVFEILPLLNPGVFIHFHDIFYPFEYPKGWVYGGRNWNENYILRAFLMNNNNYKIRLFSHYLHTHHTEVFKEMPLAYKNFGGNLWLEKCNL